MEMPAWCQRTVESKAFQFFIIGVIVLNAVVVGMETSRSLMASYGGALMLANNIILGIFILEIVLRLACYWPKPHRFFTDGWNVFDFLIVAASLMPEAGSFATVARLARLLRVTRLVSVFPELRLIISTMLRSIPSMGHVIALLSLMLYVYAVLGYHVFHETAPQYWGTLGRAASSLFQILTLEGWVEIQEASMKGHPWAWIFFASYIVVAVFVVINLFIAVVINNLETAKEEHLRAQDAENPQAAMLARIEQLKTELNEFERLLRRGEDASPVVPHAGQVKAPGVHETT
jgi:voltage-gated sodium channel